MRKYLQVVRATFQEYFVYRLNFLLWRFRSLVFTASLLFFWLAVYGRNQEIFGYQKSQMLTYLLGVVILEGIVLASRTADLAGQIRNGEISKFIIMPISLFKFLLARDFVDKSLNLFFVIFEIVFAIKLLQTPLYLQKNVFLLIIFFLHVFISLALSFFLSIIINALAFWTEEVWSTRWLLGVILQNFLAGVIFPIDVLPNWLAKIILLTPFPYLIYSPLKIWLGQMTTPAVFKSILISLFWLVILFFLMRFMWRRGIRKYGAYGG